MRLLARTFGSLSVHTPTVAPGQRIGIMGGSFNPVHAGHLLVADAALLRLGLDQLWWVVTPGNPLKSNSGLAPLAERLAAIAKLTNDPRMKVTGFEAELGSPYTAVTLRFLVRRFPDCHFVWVMGADNLASFHRWQDWRGIAQVMPIAIVDRPGWRHKALASPAAQALAHGRMSEAKAKALTAQKPPAWVFLTTKLSHLSSTALRK